MVYSFGHAGLQLCLGGGCRIVESQAWVKSTVRAFHGKLCVFCSSFARGVGVLSGRVGFGAYCAGGQGHTFEGVVYEGLAAVTLSGK